MSLKELLSYRSVRAISFVLLAAISFVYFYFYADYILFYQESNQFLSFTPNGFFQQLKHPGGFLYYIGKCLTALYYYKLAGAFVLAAIIALIGISITQLMSVLNRTIGLFVAVVVAALLVVCHTDNFFLLINSLGILSQLVALILVQRFFSTKRVWAIVLFAPIWYMLSGGFAIIFFTIYTLFLMIRHSRIALLHIPLLWFILIQTYFLLGEFVIYDSHINLLSFPFKYEKLGEQTSLYLSIWTVVAISAIVSLISNRAKEVKSVTPLALSTLIPIVALVYFLSHKDFKSERHYYKTEQLFFEQKYDELLALQKQEPSKNMLDIFLFNLVSAEKGVLNDNLFSVLQSKDCSTLFFEWKNYAQFIKRGGHFYFALGLMNEAHRWAYESMMMTELTPQVLIMLIKTDLIQHNYATAQKYIHRLAEHPFYRDQALKFRAYLYNDAAVNGDPELGSKRKLLCRSNFFIQPKDPLFNLDELLSSAPNNPIAIQYKLASLLLQKDMKGVVALLPYLEAIGMRRLPKHIEEALVAYEMLKVGAMPKLKHLKSSNQCKQRFTKYFKIFQQCKGDKNRAKRALYKEYRYSFWFYVFFS